ncbi:uncharacterized protein FSUBG_4976 [Fusarium subglutinans]|uniref:Uncharacterized protein n=1 Tax=Gibberella subglutinans TaxID=42677 RepID=A0A8H5Q427_GIBSU|nr:uncharacterized protein FSUBG_4976 [Fusarium subglutinans]KAF5607874.1 hypothetical protein FSUBG_4976 [Fusarium subglutinans]
MITTLQKPLSQSHAVLRTGASVFSRLFRFHIATPRAPFPRHQWRPPICHLQHQTRGLQTRYRPPRATPPFRALSTDEELDKLMASAARFEKEYKVAGSIKQRLAAIDKGKPDIARFREYLARTAKREDLESFVRKISERNEHKLREASIDGAAKYVSSIFCGLFIITSVVAVMPPVSKDEEEPTKPEPKSLEEKDPPQAGSTKTYRSRTKKAETETPETKCICHRPLELDNTRVL